MSKWTDMTLFLYPPRSCSSLSAERRIEKADSDSWNKVYHNKRIIKKRLLYFLDDPREEWIGMERDIREWPCEHCFDHTEDTKKYNWLLDFYFWTIPLPIEYTIPQPLVHPSIHLSLLTITTTLEWMHPMMNYSCNQSISLHLSIEDWSDLPNELKHLLFLDTHKKRRVNDEERSDSNENQLGINFILIHFSRNPWLNRIDSYNNIYFTIHSFLRYRNPLPPLSPFGVSTEEWIHGHTTSNWAITSLSFSEEREDIREQIYNKEVDVEGQ